MSQAGFTNIGTCHVCGVSIEMPAGSSAGIIRRLRLAETTIYDRPIGRTLAVAGDPYPCGHLFTFTLYLYRREDGRYQYR